MQQIIDVKADPCDVILHIVLLGQLKQCANLALRHGNFHLDIRMQMIARTKRDEFFKCRNFCAFISCPALRRIALVAEIIVLQLTIGEIGDIACAVAGSVYGRVMNQDRYIVFGELHIGLYIAIPLAHRKGIGGHGVFRCLRAVSAMIDKANLFVCGFLFLLCVIVQAEHNGALRAGCFSCRREDAGGGAAHDTGTVERIHRVERVIRGLISVGKDLSAARPRQHKTLIVGKLHDEKRHLLSGNRAVGRKFVGRSS